MQKEQITVCLKHCYSLGSFLVLLGRRFEETESMTKTPPWLVFPSRKRMPDKFNEPLHKFNKIDW